MAESSLEHDQPEDLLDAVEVHEGSGDDHVWLPWQVVDKEPLILKPALHWNVLVVPYVKFPVELLPLAGPEIDGHDKRQILGISESLVTLFSKEMFAQTGGGSLGSNLLMISCVNHELHIVIPQSHGFP